MVAVVMQPSDADAPSPAQQQDNFAVACSLLGWGEPGTPDVPSVWFIGIEEGWPWTAATVARVRGQEFIVATADPAENVGNTPAQWISKILSGVSTTCADRHWSAAWKDYRDSILWRVRSRSAQLNFYPLGRPNQQAWPQAYEALFGFGARDLGAYELAVWEKRCPKIKARWSECKPQATICFGIRPHFRRLFTLDDRPGHDRIYVYEEDRIMLVPTLQGQWGHMNHRRVEQIIDRLSHWNIRLP